MPPEVADEWAPEAQQRVFRRNLGLVTGAHLVGLVVLFAWGKLQPKATHSQVMWLDGGAFAAAGGESPAATDESPEAESQDEPPEAVPEPPTSPPPEPEPLPTDPPPPSEIVLPEATPPPATPKPATPKPATPKPQTPKPATPKPATPKPTTPKVTPKPTPASPKPTPNKPAATKAPTSPSEKPKSTPATKVAAAKSAASEKTSAAKAGSGTNTGTGKGAGKAGGGGGSGTNEFAWYYEMLDDRFTSRWEQPLSIVRSTQAFVTTLKIRIAKDGTIQLREIANSSGNPLMDESVLAAAKKVESVEPLPAGLGGDTYEVNIQFKLDQE